MDTNGNDNIAGGGGGSSAGVDLAKSPGSASGGGVELGKRGLPKLREIIIRNREDSEVSSTTTPSLNGDMLGSWRQMRRSALLTMVLPFSVTVLAADGCMVDVIR